MASDLWENEIRFQEFYRSGDPETAANYPLKNYRHPTVCKNNSANGELGLYLEERVTNPGQMLIVENTLVSCACLRDCSSDGEELSAHAPTTVLSPPLDRVPPEAHKHLAHKFAKSIPQLEPANSESKDIRNLDARRHPPVIPVDLHGGMDTGSSLGNRGPWKEVEAGKQKTLGSERVWNIIANNAICYKVRSKSREQPSPVETCEFWGMWIVPSFINHSCVPNCHGMRVGTAIIIRAAKAMDSGEELTLPYFDIFQPLCKRELAAQRWGFRCECARCTFERSIGKPYETIQKQIVNLEQQIEKSWAWKDVIARAQVTARLLHKLEDQIDSVLELSDPKLTLNRYNDIKFIEPHQVVRQVHWIHASLIEPFIAWVALCHGFCLKAYENRLLTGSVGRSEKAVKLRCLIDALSAILPSLTSVHPGNLLGQEFHSMLLEASNALIKFDLDKNLSRNLASQELYLTKANKFGCSYYGPSHELCNDGD